jgi:hypothetical protein
MYADSKTDSLWSNIAYRSRNIIINYLEDDYYIQSAPNAAPRQFKQSLHK